MDDKKVPTKKFEVIEGYTIKYHANGKTRWSKGIMKDGKPEGYWEWYRPDGTIKRSGYFLEGVPVGEWITYDQEGKVYKITKRTQDNHSTVNAANCPVRSESIDGS